MLTVNPQPLERFPVLGIYLATLDDQVCTDKEGSGFWHDFSRSPTPRNRSKPEQYEPTPGWKTTPPSRVAVH